MQKVNRHRVRPKDMFNSMHTTKHQSAVQSNKQHIGDEERTVVVFTMRGKEDFFETVEIFGNTPLPMLDDVEFDNGNVEEAENRSEALAKMVTRVGTATKYYVKVGPDSRFFNPIGLTEGQHGKHNAGERVMKFAPVNKRAFALYIQFLTTKNKASLYEAEREMA